MLSMATFADIAVREMHTCVPVGCHSFINFICSDLLPLYRILIHCTFAHRTVGNIYTKTIMNTLSD